LRIIIIIIRPERKREVRESWRVVCTFLLFTNNSRAERTYTHTHTQTPETQPKKKKHKTYKQTNRKKNSELTENTGNRRRHTAAGEEQKRETSETA
jgi:hypothetical protein